MIKVSKTYWGEPVEQLENNYYIKLEVLKNDKKTLYFESKTEVLNYLKKNNITDYTLTSIVHINGRDIKR